MKTADKKAYQRPEITKVVLEDKPVVALASCLKGGDICCTPEGELAQECNFRGQFPDES